MALVTGLKNVQKGRVAGEGNEELVNGSLGMVVAENTKVWSNWHPRADARGKPPYEGLDIFNPTR